MGDSATTGVLIVCNHRPLAVAKAEEFTDIAHTLPHSSVQGRNRMRDDLSFDNFPFIHRCFLIPEVVHRICAELRRICAGMSLASFARTCRWLREPSLNAVWYELHGLSPLVKCMPQNLWEEYGSSGGLVRFGLSFGYYHG
jgi:hypothetical protein